MMALSAVVPDAGALLCDHDSEKMAWCSWRLGKRLEVEKVLVLLGSSDFLFLVRLVLSDLSEYIRELSIVSNVYRMHNS